MYNNRRLFKTALMANFFQINRKFHVGRLFDRTSNITFLAGYAQDYYRTEQALFIDMYDYRIEIEELEPSNNNKMCFLDISGVEEDNDNKIQREIFIPQNIGQQIIFDN